MYVAMTSQSSVLRTALTVWRVCSFQRDPLTEQKLVWNALTFKELLARTVQRLCHSPGVSVNTENGGVAFDQLYKQTRAQRAHE